MPKIPKLELCVAELRARSSSMYVFIISFITRGTFTYSCRTIRSWPCNMNVAFTTIRPQRTIFWCNEWTTDRAWKRSGSMLFFLFFFFRWKLRMETWFIDKSKNKRSSSQRRNRWFIQNVSRWKKQKLKKTEEDDGLEITSRVYYNRFLLHLTPLLLTQSSPR